jgi:hypothetical protein
MVDISVIQSNPYFSVNAAKEVVLQEALQEQLLREEVIWKHKSRKLWLTCIDLNTKFFHASTACRCRYNSITCLKSTDSSRICGRDNIGFFLIGESFKLSSYVVSPFLR